MRHSVRVLATLAALTLTLPAARLRGDDATKTDSKPAVSPAPADVMTQGAVDVHGQHIVYTAIAGTITVGATDVQDAQLGLDGKPEPGSQLEANEPKDLKDAPPTARMSFFAYFKKDAKA